MTDLNSWLFEYTYFNQTQNCIESYILTVYNILQGEGNGKMRSIMTAQSPKTPQVFTDEELSEIFQINFAEIFGTSQPDSKPKTEVKSIPVKPLRESPKG